MTEFQRARRPEQKQQRRAAILTAARQLAADSGVANVSLGDVGAAVGLAKSNVVRYFGTREEIYLVLAGDCWRDWRDEVLRRLHAGDDVVDALTETLYGRRLFCDLLSHATTSLEHNVSIEAASDYKNTMVAVIGELGAAVARAHPVLTHSEGFELVTVATGLVGVLYPADNPPPTLAQVYEQEPDIAAARPSFLPTMKRILAAVAAGVTCPALLTDSGRVPTRMSAFAPLHSVVRRRARWPWTSRASARCPIWSRTWRPDNAPGHGAGCAGSHGQVCACRPVGGRSAAATAAPRVTAATA